MTIKFRNIRTGDPHRLYVDFWADGNTEGPFTESCLFELSSPVEYRHLVRNEDGWPKPVGGDFVYPWVFAGDHWADVEEPPEGWETNLEVINLIEQLLPALNHKLAKYGASVSIEDFAAYSSLENLEGVVMNVHG